MKVSLCTTVKNRLHHLKETLPYNLEANQDSDVELVVLDYWSTDGLPEWMKTQKNFMESGKLKYFRLAEPIDVFILTHAINIAFRAASGDIVCNVDADNFTGREFGAYLKEIFKNKYKIFSESNSGYGLSGRKAYRRDEFINLLGGYDEDLRYGWGYDEWDIKIRAKHLGFDVVFYDKEREGSYIHHQDDERIVNNLYSQMGTRRGKTSLGENHVKNFQENQIWASNEIHRVISEIKIVNGFYKANLYRQWGSAKLAKNFTEEVCF